MAKSSDANKETLPEFQKFRGFRKDRAFGREDDHDIHSLCAEQNSQRDEEPAGFLKLRDCFAEPVQSLSKE